MFPFTLHQLRILKTIAAQQSFGKTATILYLSQSSLSKQIMRLEKNLGVKLMNRKTNQISLTKSGEIFLKYSERILALCEETCRVLTKSRKDKREEFKIGISQSLSVFLLPKLLFFCSRVHSQLNLNFLIDSNENLANTITSQQLDIALVNAEIYEFLNDSFKTKIEHYMTDPIFFILSPTHPFAKKDKLNKKDLYTLDYISLRLKTVETSHLIQLLTSNKIDIYQFKTILQVNSIENLKTAVKLGLGAAFVSALTIEEETELEILKVVKIQKTIINQNLCLINLVSSQNCKKLIFFTEKFQKLKKELHLRTCSCRKS